MTKYDTTTGACTRDFRVCNCLAGTKQPTTSDMVIHSKLASGGIPATAGRLSRAVSNQAITNDTEVKAEVKREPGIYELEGGYHGEEEQDGRDGYNSGGVLDNDVENRVLHSKRVRHLHAMKEGNAQAVRDFVQAEQGKSDDDVLKLGVGELQLVIFRTSKRIFTPMRTGSSIQFLKI